MRETRFLRYGIGLLVALLVVIPSFHLQTALAASLTAMSDTLSDDTTGATGVTHTIDFTTATTGSIQQVSVQFSTTSGGSTEPAHLNLGSATLGTVTGMGSGWSIDTTFYSSGILSITNTSAQSVNSGTAVSIPLQNITNSQTGDCTANSLHDTCFVHITTYSDLGTTTIDSGDTTYTTNEDPSLTFQVDDVASGQTNNGVTSNISTTSTSIAFGHLGAGTVRYGTHKITVTTNAPHGYYVQVKLENDWAGDRYPANYISPFGATGATWTSPQNWSSPDGTSINSNSGWFGANTSDTRVTGWSSASGKFGPISQTPHTILLSTGPDRSGAVIYVSYAIEVNGAEGADSYSAQLVYNIVPTF